jgi:hypothetical protein
MKNSKKIRKKGSLTWNQKKTMKRCRTSTADCQDGDSKESKKDEFEKSV